MLVALSAVVPSIFVVVAVMISIVVALTIRRARDDAGG
jgi:hypothetical protein